MSLNSGVFFCYCCFFKIWNCILYNLQVMIKLFNQQFATAAFVHPRKLVTCVQMAICWKAYKTVYLSGDISWTSPMFLNSNRPVKNLLIQWCAEALCKQVSPAAFSQLLIYSCRLPDLLNSPISWSRKLLQKVGKVDSKTYLEHIIL